MKYFGKGKREIKQIKIQVRKNLPLIKHSFNGQGGAISTFPSHPLGIDIGPAKSDRGALTLFFQILQTKALRKLTSSNI